MRKRILSILVYQCVVWLLFLLFANPYTTPVKHTFSAVSFSLFWVVSFVSIITYYVISSKVLSIGICTIKDVLVQIGFTLLFDLVIACIVVGVVLSTPKGPGYFDFRGVFELAFGIFNVISFSFATIIIAVINAAKARNSSLIHRIISLCAVILLVICPAITLGLNTFSQDIGRENNEAADALTEMLVATNVKFSYDNSGYGGVGTNLMGTGYDTNMVFLDYDSKRIGFLYYDHGGQYQSFSLTKDPLTTDDYKIQKQWALALPGDKLTTYYKDNSYRTTAIQLEMDDQSVYSISGLDASEEGYHYSEQEMDGKGCFLDIEPDD